MLTSRPSPPFALKDNTSIGIGWSWSWIDLVPVPISVPHPLFLQAADPDRPLTPREWGVLEDEKPPRDPKDDAVVASLARERIHTLFDRRGDAPDAGARGFSSRKKVSHWVGANAWTDIADPDELLEGHDSNSSSNSRDDLGVQTEKDAVREGERIDEEVELADMFGDHEILGPGAAGRDERGSFEMEYKGGSNSLWEGSREEAGAVGQRARETSLAEAEGTGMGMEEERSGDDASRLERPTIETEKTTDNGDLEKGGQEEGAKTIQPEADYLENEESAQTRVNWALPRPQRRRKSLRPKQPPRPPKTPPPPTPPPVAQKKSIQPESPGRPKANGAKSSGARVRGTNVRVNGARVKAAAVKPPAPKDGTPAASVAPAKRGRGRPRLARAPQAVTARDSDGS